jgi:dTDP-4-dehydrorhamnose reductase
MKVLLIGASGQLGGDLLRNNPGHEIFAPGRETLDLTRPTQITAVIGDFTPDVIINCAAFHNVPLCEQQPEEAFLTNCVAVRELATAAQRVGAQLVTFSSDYVFGGNGQRTPYSETDTPQPVQIYGITRLAGELAALAVAPDNTLIIRTCGLYGRNRSKSKHGNFVDQRLAEAVAGLRIEMSCEQTVAPTCCDDLSRAVFALLERPGVSHGIFHLTNEGECSWYEFACAIFELSGYRPDVTPVDRGGLSGTMRRPLYSVLANTRARKLGITLRPWREALRAYLQAKRAS